jgi:divalent metal cation (Fe/Co/Zn/Cd) transporter
MWIDLDLEVDPGLSFRSAHELATDFENRLRSELTEIESMAPVADINAHIEPRSESSVSGEPLDSSRANSYLERIGAICNEFEGCDGSHNIEIHEVRGSIYLSFHLLLNASIAIAEVHRIAEGMENRLRSEFPELGRVVIHTEPSK